MIMTNYEDILFFDTETTGIGVVDKILQLALGNKELGIEFVELIKPTSKIQASAKAIHHITEDDLTDAPAFAQSDSKAIITEAINSGKVFVAHNAQFDIDMLSREGIEITRYICTLRLARTIWKDMKSYSLQFLRYELNLKVDLKGLAPHDALADVIVLEGLFQVIKDEMKCKDGDVIEEMIKRTKEPILMTSLPFGKYKGQLLEFVNKKDPQYLSWLLSVTEDDDIRESILALNS